MKPFGLSQTIAISTLAIGLAVAAPVSANTYLYPDNTDGTVWIVEARNAQPVHNWRPDPGAKAACPHQYVLFEKVANAKGRPQGFDATERGRGDYTVHLRCIWNKPRPSDEQIASILMLGGGAPARMPTRPVPGAAAPSGPAISGLRPPAQMQPPYVPAGPQVSSLNAEQELRQRLQQMTPEQRKAFLEMLQGIAPTTATPPGAMPYNGPQQHMLPARQRVYYRPL